MSDNETFDPTKVQPAVGDHKGAPSENTIRLARQQFELQQRAAEHQREHEARQAAQREAYERGQAARQIKAADAWFTSGGGSNWRGMQRPQGRYADARIAELERARGDQDSALAERVYRETIANPTASGGRI